MIIDTSVILRAFFSDEAQTKAQALLRDHVTGHVELKAPELLTYELSNALLQAERRGRLPEGQTGEIISAIEGFQIERMPLELGEMLELARRFERSAYDAAYLVLAEKLSEPFITGDSRLYHAVHSELEWVLWIDDYPLTPVS